MKGMEDKSKKEKSKRKTGLVWRENEKPNFFKTLAEARHAIEKFQTQTGTQYFNRKKSKFFGEPIVNLKNRNILFEDRKRENRVEKLTFTGVPYVLIGCRTYECVFGVDNNRTRKEKHFAKIQKDINTLKTKKVGCQAKVIVRDIAFFREFLADENTRHKKNCVSNALRERINQDIPLVQDRYYVVSYPGLEAHSGHSFGEECGAVQNIDKRISEKIIALFNDNVKSVNEMKCHVDNFVRNELCPGDDVPKTSRRFYPTLKVIRKHMHSASIKLKFSMMDQDDVTGKVEEWMRERPDDRFYFRRYEERLTETLVGIGNDDDMQIQALPTKQRLLFVHQSADQVRLMERYGNHVCLLDPLYKTTEYCIPLFLVYVKTNSDYQVVGSFAVQDESTESIAEALGVIMAWNPNFNPHYFFVDNSEEEINSIQSVFPQCNVLLSDFHREQSWERWLNVTEHGMLSHKDAALTMLKKLASSETEEIYEQLVKDLKTSEIWLVESSTKFRNWLKRLWFPNHQRWIKAYRIGVMDIVCNTADGIEQINRDLKHETLKPCRNGTLSSFLTFLINCFFPDIYDRYKSHNLRRAPGYLNFNEVIPNWMRDRPKKVVDHLIQKLNIAKDILPKFIVQEGEMSFFVSKDVTSSGYSVSLGTSVNYPSCGCFDWKATMLPCKHMLAIFEAHSDYSWESFSPLYRYSPFLNLDEDIVNVNVGHYSGIESDEDDTCGTEDIHFEEIPTPKYPKNSKAANCRDMLNQIFSLTYLVHDSEGLDILEEKLADILSKLNEMAPNENELIKVENKIDCEVSNMNESRSQLDDELSYSTSSVDISTGKRKIHLDVSFSPPPKQRPISEYSYNIDHMYGIPIEASQEVVIETGKATLTENVVEKDLSLINSYELSPREEGDIKENRMLSDESIYLAQMLLADKFKHIAGLQDTVLLGKKNTWLCNEQNLPYIQILQTQAFHWVCVANTERKITNEDHFLYDSLHGKSIPGDIISQIASYSQHPGPQLNLYVKSVQQQNNIVDSGVFAIAFATSIAYGHDPEDAFFDIKSMRTHLLECFQNKEMIPFPTNSVNRSFKNNRRKEIVELFCLCRMPYFKGEESKMIACNECNEWFHTSCEDVCSYYFLERNGIRTTWKCTKCKI